MIFFKKRNKALNLTTEKQELVWNDLIIELNKYLTQGGMENSGFGILMLNESTRDVAVIEDNVEFDSNAHVFCEDYRNSLT